MRNVMAGMVALIAFVAGGAWQFYLFVTFRQSDGTLDLQGGKPHLWLALGLTAIACVIGFLVFSRFVRYDRSAEMHITSPPSSKMLL